MLTAIYVYGSYSIIIIINSQLKGASVQRSAVPTHADSDELPEGQFYVEKLLAQRRKVVCINCYYRTELLLIHAIVL